MSKDGRVRQVRADARCCSRCVCAEEPLDTPYALLAGLHSIEVRLMATTTSVRDEVIEQFRKYVVPNYTRFPVVLVRGEGSHVWDSDGNGYLDFFAGWGCNLLGHCPE